MEILDRKLRRSSEYWKRAEKIIPCGTQTLSKAPTQFVRGVYPIYLKSGKGCHVFDVDGNEYIDYPLALGPIILGYGYPAVVQAVRNQLEDGTIFTLMHPLEVELAELLVECIPCAEMVRFAKNGSDVTSAAIRASRAYTGREKIAYCGYHGWQDWYAVTSERNKGIPSLLKDYIWSFEYNNVGSLERLFAEHKNEIAAVIIEPEGKIGHENDFLKKVEETAHRNGAVLIFDEVATGFRYALGGAQEYFEVTPDLACFGKGMANGMPISAIVGKKEIMKEFEEVFFSMTYGGETLSLAGALATINVIKEEEVIEYLWKIGKRFKDGFNRLAAEKDVDAECVSSPPRTFLVFRDPDGSESLEIKGLFMQEAVKRGVLFGSGPVFISYSHTNEDIDTTLEVCAEALEILKRAIDENKVGSYMEGEKIRVVFERY